MLDNTSFEHLYACKMLEIDISSILLKYLQIIEQGFRTRLSHIIAREFGTNDSKYPQRSNYIKHKLRKKVIRSMNQIIDNPHDNSHSYYYKEQRVPKASIPPWILIQDMNFYHVINLYLIMPEHLRNEIRQDYIVLNPDFKQENREFANALHFLREYRNIFAHSKRNFDEKIKYSLDRKLAMCCDYVMLLSPSSFNKYEKSKQLDACIMLILSFLNDKTLDERFFTEFVNTLREDNYINARGEPIQKFHNNTAFDILGLPNDFLLKLLHK